MYDSCKRHAYKESVVMLTWERDAVLWGGGWPGAGSLSRGQLLLPVCRFGTDSHSLHVFIILVMILHMKILVPKRFHEVRTK